VQVDPPVYEISVCVPSTFTEPSTGDAVNALRIRIVIVPVMFRVETHVVDPEADEVVVAMASCPLKGPISVVPLPSPPPPR
jgi:hypothetical protein